MRGARLFLGLIISTGAAIPDVFAQGGGHDLDGFIEHAMEKGNMPGLAAAVIKGDKVVWAKGYGMANFSLGTKVTTDTPFFLASISKTITATAVMQLRDEGKFDLDDNVNDDLPFDIVNPNTNISGVTYRQLFTHTSGLKDNWNVMDPMYVPGDSPVQLEVFHPNYWTPGGQYYHSTKNFYSWNAGANYSYCNQGFSLLGLLGQNLSGTPFDELCKQKILEPLGMTNSSFRLADFDPDDLAMPYHYNNTTEQYVPYGHYGYPDWPAGTLRTSVLDLATFLRAHSNGGTTGGVQILSPSTVAEMHTVQFPAQDPQGLCFYYLNTSYAGTLIGHDGGDPGVFTDMYFRPSDGTGVILLVNGDAKWAWYSDVWERLWAEAAGMSSAWAHLGKGITGTNGRPYLSGTGELMGGDPITLDLEDALENASANLVMGLGEINMPFKGGVLVPSPDFVAVGLPTGGTGELALSAMWPLGVPSNVSIYFQYWIADGAGQNGFAASNAIAGTTP